MEFEKEKLEQMLRDGAVEEVVAAIGEVLADAQLPTEQRAEAHYLRGRAYAKIGDLTGSVNEYYEAVALDANSPAAQAIEASNQIMAFYHRDRYNP